MKLISCSFCGTVMDADRIIEPSIYDHDSQEPIFGSYGWDSKTSEDMPIINCPVCDKSIFYHSGDI